MPHDQQDPNAPEDPRPEGETPVQGEMPPSMRDRYRALVDKSSGAEIDPRMKDIWPPRPPFPPRRWPLVLLIPALIVAMAFWFVVGLAGGLLAIMADIAAEICAWVSRDERRSGR